MIAERDEIRRRQAEPDDDWDEWRAISNRVVLQQRKREWCAMAGAMHEFCRLNFGDELVPDLETVLADPTLVWWARST